MNLGLRREDGSATVIPISRFPFVIGKSGCDLPLPVPGVWDSHATITLRGSSEVFISCRKETTIRLNGTPCFESRLHLGDSLQFGAERFRFELAELPQKQLGFWEKLAIIFYGVLIVLEAWLATAWLV